MSQPTLSVENLAVAIQGKSILEDITFSLNEGDILCLLGPSGCGKTTALKAIAGLIESQATSMQLFDTPLTPDLKPEARDIGFIFQDYALFPHMTVAENVGFSLRHLNKADKQNKVQEYLELVRLAEFAERYPHELSGGQQQRTAVARTLVSQPKLLLMDEPFSNIDSQVKYTLMAEMRTLLKQANITCIFVTHSKQEAFSFADKTAVINDGIIEQLDATQVIYEQPINPFVAQFMESGNLLKSEDVPDELFAHKHDTDLTHQWVLLKENGFMIGQTQKGIEGKVLDCLYIGHRYRNQIQCGPLTLWVETLAALEPKQDVHIQYMHTPLNLGEETQTSEHAQA